jgi:hypothetical protein
VTALRHVIFTATDAKFGDFVADHWLASLVDNVDLSNVDVVVLDYGLSDEQRSRIESRGAVCQSCVKDGHVVNVRFRDIANYLARRDYDQVLAIDGGDVIFQADISDVFQRDKDRFRVVCHEFEIPIHDVIMRRDDIDAGAFHDISEYLRGKPTINFGVLFGPARGFCEMWASFERTTDRFDTYGSDQLLGNYFIYHHGFVELSVDYNFAIMATRSRFRIRDGVFFNSSGEVIPIVHNCGKLEIARDIRNFGYGSGRNRRKFLVPLFLRGAFTAINFFTPRGRSMRSAPHS